MASPPPPARRVPARESVPPAALRRRLGRALAAPLPLAPSPPTADWSLPALAGHLTEVSGWGATAGLTLAFALVRDVQKRGEPAAWLTSTEHSFFPPDAAAGGVDLEALVVVRLARAQRLARAAEQLARSGAFALLVLDLGSVAVPLPMQTRLVGLARKHAMAVVFLTQKGARTPSLGSLISLRLQARRRRCAEGRFTCELRALKDKRRGPGWTHTEVLHGPDGLR